MLFACIWLGVGNVGAWDYEGHYVINQLALASLPADFPAFMLTPAGRERVAFLGGEPDRWRNSIDLPLRNVNPPDHYIDLEELKPYGLTPKTLPSLRYDFVSELAIARAMHPERFPAIDPAKDPDHTRGLVGFLPWAIVENFAKLKSCFSYLKTYQADGGTPEEVANAEANVIYVMGVMGHFVGDGSQPLHTTIHFNGWVGDNPHGYTTNPKFHAWIDGGFIARAGIRFADLAPRARPAKVLATVPAAGERDAVFAGVMRYLRAQNERVVPLYELEKTGKLKADGSPGSFDGRGFIEEQLLRGGEMLGSIWLTAWRTAPPDQYLLSQLARRAGASGPPPVPAQP